MPNIETILHEINKDLVPQFEEKLSAQGTRRDPRGAANELRADNVVLEIEYGEIEGERIGDGVVTTLRLINHLEINEEVLYGRIENIEQSTLVS